MLQNENENDEEDDDHRDGNGQHCDSKDGTIP